ncbi:MAG TPA: response regulator [Roseiflexaceae bacterium]|nr:response regulator [Roseiflexaceae bacterium]
MDSTQPDMVIPLNQAVVLLAEDNPDNLFIAIELLRRAGVKYCNGCASGQQLFQLIETLNQPVHLILLDIHIPREDGYAILKQVRATPQLARVRVAALTANVMVDDVQRARAAGFDGFIGKPINRQRFSGQVARMLAGEEVWEPR